MKKIVVFLLLVIFGAFIYLSIADRNGEYDAEKAIWASNKKFIELNKDPDGVPQNAFDAMYNEYEGLAKKFSKTKYAPGMRILAARVYLVQKRFEESRTVLETILSQYDEDNVKMQILLEIRKTYEVEKDLEGVISHLKRIQKLYPESLLGNGVPVLIAKTYGDFGKTGLSREAYYEAILGYKKIIVDNPETLRALDAQYVIGTCYSALNKWDEAVDAFGQVLLEYSHLDAMDNRLASGVVQAINLITLKHTRDLKKPLKIYESFIEKNEGHPFNQTLQGVIQRMHVVQEKVKAAEVEYQKNQNEDTKKDK